ncbi:tRNA methyltransferase 10 B [Fasciolopsis buskii]|uniref:tRNA methyltransferase 10 B n=1 Tax=Fasciolopsis buskii TaxID=27845 RepID=A0A8E0S0V5_9TREM|nr:tRNA methyltransferase 10 B [Fasciolopsis buski]
MRKEEKCRKKERTRQLIRKQIGDGTYCSKRLQKQLTKTRLQQGLVEGLVVCIDCTYEKEMSKKECSKFAQQVCRAYGANRASKTPLSLHLTNFNPSGPLASACRAQCVGFESYVVSVDEPNISYVYIYIYIYQGLEGVH